MARAISALCEILPAKRMWNRGDGSLGQKQSLPITVQDHQDGLRKRIGSIGSFSTRYRSQDSRSDSSWSFRRSRSMSSAAEETSLWKWWQWGWGWISSQKRNLCRNIAMGEDDELMLGCGRASWRHVFWKLKAELKKMINKRPTTPNSQRFKYDALSYAQNFDDGGWQDQEAQPIPYKIITNSSKKEPELPVSNKPGS